MSTIAIGAVRELAGEWELAVDVPGAEDVRGHVRFELMGEVLVQRTTVPHPDVPDSCCVVVRDVPDFSPLDFAQRFTGRVSADGATIAGEWQKSAGGRPWTRDFGLTCTRAGAAR